jgi:hypothetical protein
LHSRNRDLYEALLLPIGEERKVARPREIL